MAKYEGVLGDKIEQFALDFVNEWMQSGCETVIKESDISDLIHYGHFHWLDYRYCEMVLEEVKALLQVSYFVNGLYVDIQWKKNFPEFVWNDTYIDRISPEAKDQRSTYEAELMYLPGSRSRRDLFGEEKHIPLKDTPDF